MTHLFQIADKARLFQQREKNGSMDEEGQANSSGSFDSCTDRPQERKLSRGGTFLDLCNLYCYGYEFGHLPTGQNIWL